MKINTVVDYGMPCMMAEHHLKEIHLLMLDKKYYEAMDKCRDAQRNIDQLLRAIEFMKANDGRSN